MVTPIREKFSPQASPEILAAPRKIATREGRQFQAILDEALRDYVARHRKSRPRPHVVAAFAESIREFDELYREVAK